MSNTLTAPQKPLDFLTQELDNVRKLLKFYADPDHASLPFPEIIPPTERELFSPFEHLSTTFQLSAFERLLLLLCIGVEIDGEFASLCAQVSGQEGEARPSIGLACQLLGYKPMDALHLNLPLHSWQLVTVDLSQPLLKASVAITPWTLQYVLEGGYLDPLFSGSLQPKEIDLSFAFTPTSYQRLVDTLLFAWPDSGGLPLTQLIGKDTHAQQMVVSTVFSKRNYLPCVIHANNLPMDHTSSMAWLTGWQRQAMLQGLALVIDCGDPSTLPDPSRQLIAEVLQSCQTPVMLIGSERFPNWASLVTHDIPELNTDDQRELWGYYLGRYAAPLKKPIGALISQFNLSAEAIQSIAAQTNAQIDAQSTTEQALSLEEVNHLVWERCRVQSRARLEGLVERIEPKTTWDDLVLPEEADETLKKIIATIHKRPVAYAEWRAGGNTLRGLGITSLFSGPSGTGKTTAAEVIAHELKLDLYRVDLSQVSSKYIGETEKNLAKVFEAAERSGAVLLFDEADSIIGKRSEVKDARDRYANQEVGYLLQRMEQYSGLAVLTTNLPNALDNAFMRRIQFHVRFTPPTYKQRVVIWRNSFPETVPTKGLIYERLAQIDATGASIRNIALRATFLAAIADEPVQMKHILTTARAEMIKLGRPVTDQEIQGWVAGGRR
jgi:AAA+ superfamily predicted ATPase